MARTSGFSLVELMIVAGLTAVVLAGLGALTLISDVQVGRRSNSLQEAQEQWGRAVTFIQNEVADFDGTLSATLPLVHSCKDVKTNPVLVLNSSNPALTPIIYGVRDRAVDEEALYRGPKLLIRCGPFPDDMSPQIQTVVLDRLPADTSFQVEPSTVSPVQDAQLTITMKAGTEKDGTDITFAGDQPFRVHVQRSPTP
ncbi:MAG: prepilin-type N-terminal cleavage/methylation domain-containing protein [Cyanobacteria bacterium]|nr:prepilin-type N-terminal cleavage/methylation domain-containing protein [Cyanobacteriota bacterium]